MKRLALKLYVAAALYYIAVDLGERFAYALELRVARRVVLHLGPQVDGLHQHLDEMTRPADDGEPALRQGRKSS